MAPLPDALIDETVVSGLTLRQLDPLKGEKNQRSIHHPSKRTPIPCLDEHGKALIYEDFEEALFGYGTPRLNHLYQTRPDDGNHLPKVYLSSRNFVCGRVTTGKQELRIPCLSEINVPVDAVTHSLDNEPKHLTFTDRYAMLHQPQSVGTLSSGYQGIRGDQVFTHDQPGDESETIRSESEDYAEGVEDSDFLAILEKHVDFPRHNLDICANLPDAYLVEVNGERKIPTTHNSFQSESVHNLERYFEEVDDEFEADPELFEGILDPGLDSNIADTGGFIYSGLYTVSQ
jgi:hypothetical protein